MKIAIASDHGGYKQKLHLVAYLEAQGYEIIDFGTGSAEPVDYPDYGFPAAQAVSKGDADRAILFCTTGIGMSILANKVRGVRAALCLNEDMALMSRRHNDANVLVLPGKYLSEEEATEISELWLKEDFEAGRHSRRVSKIASFEERKAES
jgi:RpiB/LacA/LacB family sugar-phosphate isomerase